MNDELIRPETADVRNAAPAYQPPTVEWISLDCEISSYAPDQTPGEGDAPLF